MKIVKVEDLHCDAGWRVNSFLKITTDEGVVGWSEYMEGYGAQGLTGVILKLAERFLIGQDPHQHTALCRRSSGRRRFNQTAIAAIENAFVNGATWQCRKDVEVSSPTARQSKKHRATSTRPGACSRSALAANRALRQAIQVRCEGRIQCNAEPRRRVPTSCGVGPRRYVVEAIMVEGIRSTLINQRSEVEQRGASAENRFAKGNPRRIYAGYYPGHYGRGKASPTEDEVTWTPSIAPQENDHSGK